MAEFPIAISDGTVIEDFAQEPLFHHCLHFSLILTLWLWQNSMPLRTWKMISLTVCSGIPCGNRSSSSNTVWSTYSNTSCVRLLFLMTSIKLIKFSWRSFWKEQWWQNQLVTFVPFHLCLCSSLPFSLLHSMQNNCWSFQCFWNVQPMSFFFCLFMILQQRSQRQGRQQRDLQMSLCWLRAAQPENRTHKQV